MGYLVMSCERIEELNAKAAWASEGDEITYDGILAVEDAYGLERVWPEDDDATTVVMRDPDGRVVNCWLEGAELGFDDQLDWYEEEYPWPGEVITRAEFVKYDERTDLIRPSGDVQGGAELEEAIEDYELALEIVEPVRGWGYDYLIRVGEGVDASYYLADLAPEAMERNEWLQVRVSAVEKMTIRRLASAAGMDMSEYVRQRLLG